MTDVSKVSEETLAWLDSVLAATDPGPWVAWLEGRDHEAGDSFIMVGREGDRREDMYVTRDSGPAPGADLEAIGVALTYLPVLIEEIRRHRSGA